jgi:hypothetical protein
MTVQKMKNTKTLSRTAQLMGGASIAVLMAYGPASAQDVNITVNRAQAAPASAFTAANVTGFDTVSVNTQDSRAAVTATIAGGALDSNVAGSGTSAVDIESNQFAATASGNVFTLSAQQLGSPGTGSDGTLAALSGQFADGTVSTSITGSQLTIDGSGDATDTSMAASTNAISATTTVNNATVVFADDISADLAGDLAQANANFITSPITLTGGDLTAQELLSVEGGGSVVASTQAIAGSGLASVATITGSGIAVSLGDLDATDSSLSVDGNDIRATLTGNRASTGTDVTVDTAFVNTAAVLTQQQIGDGAVDVGLISTADTSTLSVALDNATDSSLAVSSTTIGARANGNVATLSGTGATGTVADGTFLRVDANTISSNTAGGVIDNDLGSIVTFANSAGTGVPGFGFVAGSQQAIESSGGNAGTIEASSDGNSLSVTASGPSNVGGDLLRSSVSVEDNTAFALASGNTGGTAIDLTATSITATAGLASDQTLSGTGVDALLGDTSAFALSATAEGDVTSSSILVDDNLSVAEASGNTGQTLLSADADTALLSNNTTDRGAGVVNITAGTLATTTTADFGLAANQLITGSDLTATAVSTLGATVGATTGTADDAGAIDASTISLSSNAQQATASGNTLTNGIALSGNVVGAVDTNGIFTDFSSAVSSLTSLQQIDSDVTAGSTTTLSLTQADFATADTTSVNASSLTIDANENRSTATANRAGNTLAVTADTAIVGADAANANAIIDTNATNDITAAGTSGLANVQSSTGTAIGASTLATADITAGGAGATAASLSGSTASISDNITTASGAANIGTSAITLDAGTEITSSAALTNQQTSSSAVTGSATFDAANGVGTEGILLTGIVTGSTLGIDDNVTVGSAMGNQTANALSVTATTIDRTANAVTGVLDQRSTDATIDNVGADFASLNTQVQTGNISSTAVNSGTISVAESTTGNDANLTNSSATLNGNSLQSDAMSNLATNSVSLDGSAGVTATTTGLASIQQTGVFGGTAVDIGSVTRGTFNVVTEDGDITNSTVAIDGNQAFDSATSNRATNTLSVAGNAISGTSADLTTLGITLEPTVGAKVDGDNSLSSVQISNLGTGAAGLTSASTIGGTIGLGGTTGGAGVSGSSVSISDNFARSFGMGNDASNAISLAADTSFSGTAGLTGTQVLSGDVTSAATVNADLDASVVAATDAVASSSLATDGNIAFSRAMGNNQNNTLGVSGTSITGVSTAAVDQEASLAALGAANTVDRTLEGDNILTAFQGLLGGVSGTATVDSNILATDDIDASSVSASENVAQSNVIGNAGNNLLNLTADSGVTGVSVLASEQNGRTSANISSVADLDFAVDQEATATADDFTSSALNVDNNIGFSTAFGNDVANRLNATGTTITGNDDALSVAGITAAGIVSGTSDNLVGNVQFRDASTVSSIATLNATLFGTADLGAAANQLDGSSVSLSGNTLDSTATSNRANNALVLNAATGLTAGGAIANQQNSASAVTSDVRLVGSVGSAVFDDVNASSIAIRNNTGIARAAGNDATNVLNANAGTAITGIVGTGSATALAGALNATGTFASASNQVNSGAVLARASFDTALSDESDLSVQTAALNSASVDLSGNRLVADAVSNRVVNSMTVSGRSPSTLVSTALTTRQVASGAVTSEVDSFRLASTNAALTSSSVGLSGNTFSASAGGNSAVSRLIRD